MATAKIEHELGIRGSYYFRMVPKSYDERIIIEVSALGHEVGYHYETMDSVSARHRDADDSVSRSDLFRKGNNDYFDAENAPHNDELIDVAYKTFVKNLEAFRKIADVKTICMHGSPRSKFDNRKIWEKYSYRELGIVGEPYFDVDFNEVFYLTDTGRRWDGHRVSIRDKVPQQDKWSKQGLVFRTTQEIILAAQQGILPNRIMITLHPQRWTNNLMPWTKELFWQNAKNMVKGMIVSRGNLG